MGPRNWSAYLPGLVVLGTHGLENTVCRIPDRLDVADSIVEVAAAREAAAVFIGTHGTSGIRSHLLGSTSRRVFARCQRPVVVVRDPQGGGVR
jgi:nucleotide-binding universal stress UspA family protein